MMRVLLCIIAMVTATNKSITEDILLFDFHPILSVDKPDFTINFGTDRIELTVPLITVWSEYTSYDHLSRRTRQKAVTYQTDMLRSHIISTLYGAIRERIEVEIPTHYDEDVIMDVVKELNYARFPSVYLRVYRIVVIKVPKSFI